MPSLLSKPSLTIVQHTVLEIGGGASRIAQVLHRAVQEHGGVGRYSFEVPETLSGREALARRPWLETLLDVLRARRCAHLHASLDWLALLRSVPDEAHRLVITLHDCRLITGGCPYPLECEHFLTRCVDPCPRGFPQAHKRQAAQLDALRRLRPLLVCPSRWMRGLVTKVLPESDSRCLPNGVPWPDILPPRREARASLGLTPQARVALFIAHGGEGAAYKGGAHWRGIWLGIKSQCPQTVGFFVGGEEQGREDDLVLLPYLGEDRLSQLLRAADVFVYPTLADNHPLIVLEAMAMGCPVVSWNAGGVPEQIEHGRTGLLVPEGDVLGPGQCCRHIAQHPCAERLPGAGGPCPWAEAL